MYAFNRPPIVLLTQPSRIQIWMPPPNNNIQTLQHNLHTKDAQYGAELWNIKKSELLMLERANRKILRTNQSLPTRCPTVALTSLIGASNIEDITQRNRLTFLTSTMALKPSALPRGYYSAVPSTLLQHRGAPRGKGPRPSEPS